MIRQVPHNVKWKMFKNFWFLWFLLFIFPFCQSVNSILTWRFHNGMNNDANSLSIYLVNFGSYEVANVHKGEQFGRPLNKELGPLK